MSDTIALIFNDMIKSGTYMRTREQAFIKVILKKGKDPLLPGLYRPIFLMNLDVKYLSTILGKVLPNLIHPSQTAFS